MKYLVVSLCILFSCQLLAQEVTTFPGFWGPQYYEDDRRISLSEVQALIQKDSEANQLWKKAQSHQTIAWVALAAEIGFLAWAVTSNSDDITIPAVGVLVTGGISIGYSLSAASLQKRSILKYNSNLDSAALHLGPTHNGLGLVLSF